GDPGQAGLPAGHVGLIEGDVDPDLGEHLCDSVAHQAGARDEDPLDRHAHSLPSALLRRGPQGNCYAPLMHVATVRRYGTCLGPGDGVTYGRSRMQRHMRRVLALLAAGGLLGGVVISAPTALAGDASTYVVLYRSVAVPADVAQRVSRAGGTLVASYGQIGVAIARSSSATFKSALAADSRIAAVAATDRTAVRLRDLTQDGAAAGAEANTPVSDTDPLSSYQ